MYAAWLITCRVVAIIGLILQVIGVVLVVILLIWVLCETMRCCDDDAGWCDRCIIYLTPIVWILAGTSLDYFIVLMLSKNDDNNNNYTMIY